MGDDFSRMEDFSNAADIKAEQTQPPQNNEEDEKESND